MPAYGKALLGLSQKSFPTGFGQVEFEVCFGVNLSTLPTGTTTAWGMRYSARILLMLTKQMNFQFSLVI
ncbi:hypothetical protein DSOL_5370 [Desulfosporosinus metallidurans]|uniref:Uncharacterized protein n=1 Tax=Desulfosporosinus metallidurans TaxID=1888891 RepID=A0A1Q8QCU3_9FIRM|nr:hypothetical protein DSOL_5370 [Desulfosporosinus metallidurans]